MKPKNVLVTGSSGFIGQQLVKRLLLLGHRVLGIDLRPPAQASKKYRFVQKPITLRDLKNTGFKPEWIFHCAGGGSVGFAENHPPEDFQMNVATCLEVIDFARQSRRSASVVFLSSAAVYGDAVRKLLDEKMPARPVSSYGFHKQLMEKLVRFYARRWSVPSVLVRVFSVYGEGLQKQVFWDAAKKMHGRKALFFGSGRETRDFVHVEDVCRFLARIIGKANREVPIYNCGLGKPVRMNSALGLLASELGKAPPRFNRKPRPGDPKQLVCNPSRALQTGWRPEVAFPEGIRRYAKWYQAAAVKKSASPKK